MDAIVIKDIVDENGLVIPKGSVMYDMIDETKTEDVDYDYSGTWPSMKGTYRMCVNKDEIEFIGDSDD